ncbi:hypothetical protein C2R22_09455 [Salinigranum rubrum]|uniref:Lipoprotein n=1 Tax=Salinigranum rubrum TaxID=755307 RepID=A0A2I8VIT5_9EURY|nr:hypothetical protein [Salinigranum rubrum]AUV81846.1 hypothetical protein C2R22_09455 [Salinigranum rubrum]
MRRRALLSSAALGLAATTGCLGDVRHTVSGDIRHEHARLTVHPASTRFVRGGLTAGSDDRFRAWLFPEAPPDDQTVFTDARGAEEQREWDDEVHSENYDAGFTLLMQSRSPRANPHQAEPTFPDDPAWTGWRRAQFPFEFVTRDLDPDIVPDADRVVSTYLGYFTAGTTPTTGTVAVHEEVDGVGMGTLIEEVETRRWHPP